MSLVKDTICLRAAELSYVGEGHVFVEKPFERENGLGVTYGIIIEKRDEFHADGFWWGTGLVSGEPDIAREPILSLYAPKGFGPRQVVFVRSQDRQFTSSVRSEGTLESYIQHLNPSESETFLEDLQGYTFVGLQVN